MKHLTMYHSCFLLRPIKGNTMSSKSTIKTLNVSTYIKPGVDGLLTLSKAIFNKFNKEQQMILLTQLCSAVFWYTNKPSNTSSDKIKASCLKGLSYYCFKQLNIETLPVEINKFGTQITRENTFLDIFDVENDLFKTKGWRRLMSPTSYLGYWINESTLQIVSFCEGDIVTSKAFNLESLIASKDFIIQWHKDN